MRGCKLNQSTKQFLTNLLALTEQHFNLDELRSLCFHLGINYDRLRGETIDVKASELILYHGRRVQLPDLLTRLKAERPNVSWPELPADFHLPTNDEPPTRKPPLQLPPRATHFTGRQEELVKLLDSLQPGRIVTLVGPGGIGKTALAAEATNTLITNNQPNQPPPLFPDGLIFHTFYGHPEIIRAADHIVRSFGEDPNPNPLAAAARALGRRTALLILDGAEEADDLNALLRLRSNCAVLITSRSRKDVHHVEIEVSRLPTEDAITLLRAWGKQWADDDEAVRAICELVGNLALAVRLAGAYLYQGNEFATEYLGWLRASPLQALDFGQRRKESIPVLLEKSVAQLSAEAQSALAIFGCLFLAPIDLPPLAAALNLDNQQTRHTLGELSRFGLLLRTGQTFELAHPLLHTYAREQLAVGSEQLERLGDYFNQLARRERERGLAGYRVLDGVRPHIITLFGRLLAAEQWQTTNSLTWAIESYLDVQGRWLDRITALEAGLAAARALDRKYDESSHTMHLGLASYYLGQVERAIGFYEQALAIHREIGDRRGEGNDLGNLGLAYRHLGQVERAIGFYEQALAIRREIGDRRGEGSDLGNLGLAYAALGQVERAIGFHEQSLAISREIGDRQGEGNDLGNLGLAYAALGQVERAIGFYEQALAISREIGDRRGEGSDLGNLGNAYYSLGQVERAIGFHEQALAIRREIGDRRGEGSDLGNLGIAYRHLGQVERAIGFHEQALAIRREIGDRRGEGSDLGNLGIAYRHLGQVERAIGFYEQALAIRREIGDRQGEGIDLFNLGIVHEKLEQPDQAAAYYQQSLTIFEEIKSPYAERARQALANLRSNTDE